MKDKRPKKGYGSEYDYSITQKSNIPAVSAFTIFGNNSRSKVSATIKDWNVDGIDTTVSWRDGNLWTFSGSDLREEGFSEGWMRDDMTAGIFEVDGSQIELIIAKLNRFERNVTVLFE